MKSEGTRRVLFLCTANSARSILAEAILNRQSGETAVAFSAGSQPAGKVHPYAVELLESLGYATGGLRSKSWDEFARPGAQPMDHIVTVCNNAAGEACPLWPGQPATDHWDVVDPASAGADGEARRQAFLMTYRELMSRIDGLLERIRQTP